MGNSQDDPRLPLRVGFMGTPDFAVPTLAALLDVRHDVAAVYTQPPRPAGRGHQTRRSPVHAFAESRGLSVRMPATLKEDDIQPAFAALGLDAAVVVAYGLILPPAILAAPRLGCFNLHASLLPRWRGAAPIQWAIIAGDRETGATVMKMDEGLDTGPILLQARCPIEAATTAAALHDTLAERGASLMVEALDRYARGLLDPRLQPAAGVTYAPKLRREDGRLDWRRPAEELARLVRGCTPWPGAWFPLEGERIKVLEAEALAAKGDARAPGTVIDNRLTVACGAGSLRLVRVQRGGRVAMAATAFLRGRPVLAGTILSAEGNPA